MKEQPLYIDYNTCLNMKNINQWDLCEKDFILRAKVVIEIKQKALRTQILN